MKLRTHSADKFRNHRPGSAGKLAFILVLLLCPTWLFAESDEGRDLKHELGFWLGASNPMPYSHLDETLDSNIGGGGFYRMQWPWILHTEFGFSYSNYPSRSTQSLITVPVYAALEYQLPLTFQLNVFLKAGGGASYLVVRPYNRWGWDPLLFAGAEFSIRAGRKVRIGLRLDYNMVYEKHLKPPPEAELLKWFGTTDPRYQSINDFRVRNGSFFHFGLMVSFLL